MMVLIPTATWRTMQKLVDTGQFASKSEIVRLALLNFINKMLETQSARQR